jgi:hypothetical protein
LDKYIYIYIQAALHGHIPILKWAIEKNCPWDKHTQLNVKLGKNSIVRKWFINNGLLL